MADKPVWRVILRRRNGRFVKEWLAKSKYAAKKCRDREESRYDDEFYVEILSPDGNIL